MRAGWGLLLALWACGNEVEPPDGGALDSGPADTGQVLDVGLDAAIFDQGADAGPADLSFADAAPPDADPVDLGPIDPLVGRGTVELVAEGFTFTEGPQWIEADGTLLFSDINGNTIHRLTPPAAISPYRMPSNNSNGLAIDVQGRLLAAEHGARRVSVATLGQAEVTLVERYQGQQLNSPNDLVVRSDGTIYFTDPPYGLGNRQREVPFNGVYRIDPLGALEVEWEGPLSSRPNGIALSPDEQVLYVADTVGLVRAYDVLGSGALTNERTLVPNISGPDGMAVDSAGNLYVTAGTGVEVYGPDGHSFGVIPVPRQPANCAFGGADHRTLYITARQGLYRVSLSIPGLP
jgi:gluconolactonase